MSSHLNWKNLRSWNGSQNSAFEELCCQLAAYETVEAGSKFIRKGTPDGGVECFWILPNDDEWGWQAKFFDAVGDKQWQQLDDSVETALEKHPRLIQYTICLPLNRPDARIEGQESLLDKWNKRVQKWEEWANQEKRNVNFIYWGEHEIFERLTCEEHRGRYYFWFHGELFSLEWFQSRLDEAIANAGVRYTPELNIDLLIAKLFDGLGRTESFFNRFEIIKGEISKSLPKSRDSEEEIETTVVSKQLQEKLNNLFTHLNQLESDNLSKFDFTTIAQLASESKTLANEYRDALRRLETETKKAKGNLYNSYDYELRELIGQLSSLINLSKSSEANLANVPALLLLGQAGTGKTHLLCDVAKNRIQLGLPTVILLGEQFNNSEPWSQILSLLKLSCSVEEFLGALETAAQVKQCKALIFIDALNEGEGKSFWKKHFAGMLTTLSRFPRVGIAVSVRTPYENVVIPENLTSDKLIREHHQGFAGHEYQATRTFFDHYKIKRPSVPLLNPEFQNPLFLKLFCQGLENKGLTEVPPGYYGITAVFDFLVDSVNKKLAKEEYLDFDEQSKLVQKAMQELAKLIATGNKQWLTREKAQSAVNAFLPCKGYHNSLFRHLLVEGLLAEDRFYQGNDEWIEGIRFSYERFSDHLIVKYLLDKHLDTNNPSLSFQAEQPLGTLISDIYACWENRSLVDALSIQIPERLQQELTDIAPHCANFPQVIASFVESLIWRKPTSITEATLQYINEYVIQDEDEDTQNQLIEAFLTISTKPEHPYNADFLHQHLKEFSMAERDAWWSIFLHRQYGQHGAIDRLVEWAWSQEDKSHINDESIRLCATALAWFLTTSNRFLRDRSTKALVAILTPRIHLLKDLIPQFLDVNDWYVLERLFAVAYGCAMRNNNNQAIGELAQNVYHWIFEDGEPIPHILLRDYARGVIEVALYSQADLEIDVSKIRPPYKSEWLSYISSEDELKERLAKLKQEQNNNIQNSYSLNGLYRIESSLGNHGDFARYIIGTNHGSFSWSFRRLNEPYKPSSKEIYETFLDSLTDRQKKAWETYHIVLKNIDYYRKLELDKRIEIFKQEFTESKLKEYMKSSENSFIKTLGKKKTKIYEESVISYLNNPNIDEYRFDLSIAQQWIFWRVLELGYSVERHGCFDAHISSDSYIYTRTDYSYAERIGKKYQWLAYHEFLARVSDNFEFRGDNWIESDKNGYQGTWQLRVRDIDPSCLLNGTETDNNNQSTPSCWWSQEYDNWTSTTDIIDWVNKTNDLPPVEAFIEVINPKDNSRWLALENFRRWIEPIPIGEDKYQFPRRQLHYMIKSYIVHKEDIDCLYNWAIQQDFMGRWMPESKEQIHIHLGEFFWSEAFNYYNIPYFNHDEWTEGTQDQIPKKILVTTDKYLVENGINDCSIDNTYSIYLPCQWLVKNMNLSWNGVEGHFFNNHEELIAFDPSIREFGSNACLIKYDALLSFLDKQGYDILWTVLGEKMIFNSYFSDNNHSSKISGAFRFKDGKLIGKSTLSKSY